MLLLSEIMARLHGVDMPVLQFIEVSEDGGAADVAASFALASAACVGRTLLVRLQPGESRDRLQISVADQQQTAPGPRTRKAPEETFEIVPDSAVAGLCHAWVRYDPTRSFRNRNNMADTWLDGVSLDFRLVVIESRSPERCPATLDLATRCHGSVLVVKAGQTSLSEARIVMRQVQIAGGTLIGSVLHEAPGTPSYSIFGKWTRRLGKPAR